jgi:hypothetical protein
MSQKEWRTIPGPSLVEPAVVAMALWVSMVPRAHGLVTGEAVGVCQTAIPYKKLSSGSTKAWIVATAQEAYHFPSGELSYARPPYSLFHRRCDRLR